MLMMATAGIFRLEHQEFLNLTEIHSVVTSRIVTAVDLNKSDHTHTQAQALPPRITLSLKKMIEQSSCFVENIIVWAVMADILAVMVFGWYRMVKDDE